MNQDKTSEDVKGIDMIRGRPPSYAYLPSALTQPLL